MDTTEQHRLWLDRIGRVLAELKGNPTDHPAFAEQARHAVACGDERSADAAADCQASRA
jgi:hypothetical protein